METIEKVFNLLTETPEYVSGQQIANKSRVRPSGKQSVL